MDITEILKALESNTGSFPKEALAAAVEKREEITSVLLRSLEDTVDRAGEIVESDSGGTHFAHIYAMYLLAQFRERRAYPLVIRFARLEEKLLDVLGGDFITEDLCRVLASVCDGDTAPIEGLIEDLSLYEYVRSAAMRSLLVLVREDRKNRNDVVAYFKTLFEGKLERTHSHAWDALVSYTTKLHPGEVMDHIAKCYEEGLVYPGFIALRDVEQACQKNKERVLEEFSEHERGFIENVVEEMEWCACFEKHNSTVSELNLLPFPPARQTPSNPIPSLHSGKVKPNAPCPCGSGKKYKKCCGRSDGYPADIVSPNAEPKIGQQLLCEESVRRDIETIVDCALQGIIRVVGAGPLVFFSTETGDAWMLDSEDRKARCLAKAWEPLPYTVTKRRNAPDVFEISWDAEYFIQGEEFVVAESSGRMRSIFGYPVREIKETICLISAMPLSVNSPTKIMRPSQEEPE